MRKIDGILFILASIGFNISESGFLFITKWLVYFIAGSSLLSLSNFTLFRNGQWYDLDRQGIYTDLFNTIFRFFTDSIFNSLQNCLILQQTMINTM